MTAHRIDEELLGALAAQESIDDASDFRDRPPSLLTIAPALGFVDDQISNAVRDTPGSAIGVGGDLSSLSDAARAASYAREWNIPVAHAGYDALLRDPEVDAIYLPLPNTLHVEWTLRAVDAGKHVLCEKPLTRRAADAEEAFDAAARAGRLLMEAFMWRYHPQTEALVRLAAEIAPLRLVRAAFGFRLPEEDTTNVRLQRDLEGGALMDVGCYCVSGARLLAVAAAVFLLAAFRFEVVGGEFPTIRSVWTRVEISPRRTWRMASSTRAKSSRPSTIAFVTL